LVAVREFPLHTDRCAQLVKCLYAKEHFRRHRDAYYEPKDEQTTVITILINASLGRSPDLFCSRRFVGNG